LIHIDKSIYAARRRESVFIWYRLVLHFVGFYTMLSLVNKKTVGNNSTCISGTR